MDDVESLKARLAEAEAKLSKEEPWSWGRFFNGFVSGRRYGKDFALLVRLTVLAVVGLIVLYGAYSVYLRFFPKKQTSVVSQTHTSGPLNISSQGGDVDNEDDHSTDTKTVSVTINEAPFGKGLLGAFGSQAKFQGNEERAEKKK